MRRRKVARVTVCANGEGEGKDVDGGEGCEALAEGASVYTGDGDGDAVFGEDLDHVEESDGVAAEAVVGVDEEDGVHRGSSSLDAATWMREKSLRAMAAQS
jgi:hypothetical protein